MIDVRSLVKVQALVEAGRIDEANLALGEIACAIPQPASVSSATQASEIMEVCGCLGQMLKKNGQYRMAVPWLNTLCQVAGRFAPNSVDTAWDHYDYAEALVAYSDRFVEPHRTTYRDHARKMWEQAQRINDASENRSPRLAEKIAHLKQVT